MSIAQTAQQYATQFYNWGQQQFANTSAITDANINNYLTAASTAMGLANNNVSRYENLFQPQENALIQDANSYASPSRVALEMGAAQSDAAQAQETARTNAIRDLQSYGINPSDGRYAGLDVADRAAAAAAEAGAGQQARIATEATGRQLRQNAITVGQSYPGQAVNALNAGFSGIAGAENAALSNVNTGVNAMTPAQQFLAQAGGLKYPPLGQSGGSSNSGSSPSQPKAPGAPSAPGGPGGPGSSSYANQPTGGPGQSASFVPFGGSGGNAPGNPFDPNSSANNFGVNDTGGSFNPDPYAGTNPDFGGLPNAGPDMGGGYYGNLTAPGDANTFDSGASPMPMDTSGYTSGTSMGDMSTMSPTYSDYGGGTGATSDYVDPSAMALGGTVPAYAIGGPTTGGHVPMQASPSQGQQTDDVPANLNAGEFVVPRDVAAWKGQEFFQKLIAQSRKARVTAPAHAQQGPARQGPPRFASQAMG